MIANEEGDSPLGVENSVSSLRQYVKGGLIALVLVAPVLVHHSYSEWRFERRIEQTLDSLNAQDVLGQPIRFSAYTWLSRCDEGAAASHYTGTDIINICPSDEFYSTAGALASTILHEHAHWWFHNRLSEQMKASFWSTVEPRIQLLRTALENMPTKVGDDLADYQRAVLKEPMYRQNYGTSFDEKWPSEVFALIAQNLVAPILPDGSPIPSELVPYYSGFIHPTLHQRSSKR